MSTSKIAHVVILSAVLVIGSRTALAAPPNSEHESVSELSEVLVLGRGVDLEGGKDLTPVFEAPSSFTVINAERFELQQMVTVEDLFRETTGVTTTKTVSSYPQFFARGFQISSFLVDGVPGSAGVTAPFTVPDLFLYDGVELLRGPSALFSGSGSPGGSVNFTSKRPLSEFAASGSIEGGSWSFKRIEADVSSPLTSDASIRGRVGGAWQDADEFIDHYKKNRRLFFGAVAFDLPEDTTLTVGGHYDDYNSTIQVGLPGATDVGLLDLPRSTYIGGNQNYFDTKSGQVYGELAHRFNNRWKSRLNVQYTKLDREEEYVWGRGPITATDGEIALNAYHGKHDADLLSADISTIGEFELFGRNQGLLFGADYQRLDWAYRSNSSSPDGFTFDVYHPVIPAQPALPLTPGLPEYFSGKEIYTQYGIYGQTRLSVTDQLTGIIGGRVAWVTDEYQEFDAVPTGAYSVKAKLAPYLGLVYNLTARWNAYVSYADVFQPQSATRSDGSPLGPVIGSQYEAGVKGSLNNGRLLLTGAVYRIRESNLAVADPSDPNFSVAAGLQQSKGVELEANGQITDHWMLNGGYTYNRNETLEDSDPTLVGTQFMPVTPKHSVKLFTNYGFPTGALARLSVGGGITWNSRETGTGVTQGQYAVVGARAGYQISDHLDLTVNVDNLFDRRYYENIRDLRFGNYYGAPRSIAARIKYHY